MSEQKFKKGEIVLFDTLGSNYLAEYIRPLEDDDHLARNWCCEVEKDQWNGELITSGLNGVFHKPSKATKKHLDTYNDLVKKHT